MIKAENNLQCKDVPLKIQVTNFSTFRIFKNIVVLSVVFMVTFTAFDSLSVLQSTLNHDGGIGVVCQALIYGFFSFSSLLFPKYVIKKFGCKITLILSMCFYVPYIASNLYPHWSLMVPAAILNGLAASLLWGSQCTYLNNIARLYVTNSLKSKDKKMESLNAKCDVAVVSSHEISLNQNCGEREISKGDSNKSHKTLATPSDDSFNTSSADHLQNAKVKNEDNKNQIYLVPNENETLNGYAQTSHAMSDASFNKSIESMTARFFGIHGMFYLSSHMWSNLMSYYVLQNDAIHSDQILNTSCICGAQFCNEKSDCLINNLLQPSQDTRNVLSGLCISLSVISILCLAIFLDPLDDKEKVDFSLELLLATWKHSKKKIQILLTPLTFYVGMLQGFYTGDFTMSYVGCAWGTYHVGFVSICYGATCGISSPASGWLVRQVGRLSIFLLASLINLSAQVLLLVWTPSAENTVLFFLISGFWGISLGILWSQLKAMYGFFFKKNEEAAFAAYHLWYSLGFCLSLAYSNHLCTYLKIYFLIFILILGMIGYLWVELQTKQQLNVN